MPMFIHVRRMLEKGCRVLYVDHSCSVSSSLALACGVGMICVTCVDAIENGVSPVAGVDRVTVSLLLNQADVLFDSSVVSAEQVRGAWCDIVWCVANAL